MNSEREILKAWERDRAYHRRLFRIVPIALVLVLLLFATSDQVSMTELEKHFGYKGEMQLLPEISIMPDDDPFSAVERQSRMRPLTSVDLDVIEGSDISESEVVKEEEDEEPEVEELELDEYEVATRPSQRDVPYSENYIILKMVKPEYPYYELENGIEGSVTVEMFVNDDGIVELASVLSAIGPKSFEESSLKAVKQFVFQPPKKGDEPTSMWIRFLIKFRIYQ